MERKTKRGWLQQVTAFLCAFLLLLCPILITAGLAMVEVLVLESEGTLPQGLSGFCTVVVLALWLGTAILTKLRLHSTLFRGPMPYTGLVLAGLVLLSVLFYVVGFAMEQEVLPLVEGLWAVCRLLGAPAAVAVRGAQGLLDCELGTAAMLTCGAYLLIGLVAAWPVAAKKPQKRKAKAMA